MAEINQEGVYKGVLLEKAVKLSKNGFPQLEVYFLATEFYDEDSGVWTDCSENDLRIHDYLMLWGKNGPTRTNEQVQVALGWDGSSFAELSDLDTEGRVVQLRVEANKNPEYAAKYPFKAAWIDAADASPGRMMKPLDAAALKELDAKFRGQMKPKPKAAPAKAAQTPTKTKKQPTTPATPAPPTKKPKPTPAPIPSGSKELTKEQAWETLMNLSRDIEDRDDVVGQAFLDACEAIGGDKEEEAFTLQDWAAVCDHVVDALKLVPF